jgi:type IV secretory pathway VirB3-like protein
MNTVMSKMSGISGLIVVQLSASLEYQCSMESIMQVHIRNKWQKKTGVKMKSSIFWDIRSYSPLKVT